MFKFYNVSDLETIDKIIGEARTIKFSSAFNLNDPFEFKFNLNIDPFADRQEAEFLKANPSKTITDFIDWQQQVKDNEGFVWYTEQQQRNTIAQMITLCSFTGNNINNLMWSHYTNNHTGFCVEYSDDFKDFLKSHKDFFAFDAVQYSDTPPLVDSLESNTSKISKMMFNKQSEWKYENEYRVIMLSNNETDYIQIEPKHIKAVYIGARARKIENRIKEICISNNIDIYYGITIGKTYEVSFEKHKEGTIFTRSFWS